MSSFLSYMREEAPEDIPTPLRSWTACRYPVLDTAAGRGRVPLAVRYQYMSEFEGVVRDPYPGGESIVLMRLAQVGLVRSYDMNNGLRETHVGCGFGFFTV